jgi:hypothetical protein
MHEPEPRRVSGIRCGTDGRRPAFLPFALLILLFSFPFSCARIVNEFNILQRQK